MMKRRSIKRVARQTQPKRVSKPRWRRPVRRAPSSSSGESLFQTIVIWIVLAVLAGGLIWYLFIWAIVPKLIMNKDSRTVAVMPSDAGGVVLVAQLEPETSDSKVFIIPGDEQVQLPGEYGEYRLNAVYPLLKIENKDDRYITGTMNRVLGVFLDQEISVTGTLNDESEVLKDQIKQAFWQEFSRDKSAALDLLRMWYLLKSNAEVTKLSSVKELVKQVRNINGGTFASRDECRVAILNSTATPGLAGGLSDIVEKNGGIVIRLGQYTQEVENSQLLFDPSVPECQPALEQLKTLSPVPFEIKEDPAVQGTFRAPVVAIIGKNFE